MNVMRFLVAYLLYTCVVLLSVWEIKRHAILL